MSLAKTKDPILRKYDGRCEACYMRIEKCICDLIPEIDIKTYVTVIMHHRESYKTTNTARLACMALKNSRIILRGLKHEPLNENEILYPNHHPVFLTLHETAKTLTPEFVASLPRPLHLIVPDGNWRQARKMGYREDTLKNMTWVKLPPGPKSSYKLRHEHLDEGLSTLEAMSRALAALESADIEEKMMSFFIPMVERTISTRPKWR